MYEPTVRKSDHDELLVVGLRNPSVHRGKHPVKDPEISRRKE